MYLKVPEKAGFDENSKWFASAKFRVKDSKTKLDNAELGDWLSYFQVCVNIARGVKRLHAAGLAHSDLSYNNVLFYKKLQYKKYNYKKTYFYN